MTSQDPRHQCILVFFGTCGTTVGQKSLHRLFGQLNSGHQQLSGALRAHVQAADEAFDTRLVRNRRDDVAAAKEEPVDRDHITLTL